MKKLSEYVLGRLMSGALVAPIHLAMLLLLKGMKSLTGVLKPVAHLLPKWLPRGSGAVAGGGVVIRS